MTPGYYLKDLEYFNPLHLNQKPKILFNLTRIEDGKAYGKQYFISYNDRYEPNIFARTPDTTEKFWVVMMHQWTPVPELHYITLRH